MRPQFAVLALMLLLAPPAFAADSGEFKSFAPKDGGFTISFPGKPELSTSTATTDLGPVEMHEFAVKRSKDKETYALIYCDLPADMVKDADPETLLNRVRDGGAASVHAKASKETKITLDGNPGRDLEVGGLGGKRIWRLYLVGGRLYQLLVTSDAGRPSAEQAKKFFTSFKLAKTATSAEPSATAVPKE